MLGPRHITPQLLFGVWHKAENQLSCHVSGAIAAPRQRNPAYGLAGLDRTAHIAPPTAATVAVDSALFGQPYGARLAHRPDEPETHAGLQPPQSFWSRVFFFEASWEDSQPAPERLPWTLTGLLAGYHHNFSGMSLFMKSEPDTRFGTEQFNLVERSQ